MSNGARQIRRVKISEVLETQVDYLAPLTRKTPPATLPTTLPTTLRRTGGRALSRLATLLMILALLMIIAGRTVVAQSMDQIGAGTLLFRSDNADVEAPRLQTEVDIAISGMVAVVNVRQRFHNPGTEHVEGVYVFPLPDEAAVDSLKLHIANRVVIGEIQEKSTARKTYAKAREDGQRASLVEQQRPNLFTTAVANIPPGETVEVEITYLQTLEYLQGAFSIRFPMTVTPRYEPDQAPLFASTVANMVSDPTASLNADGLPVVLQGLHEAANEARINVRLDAGFPLARIESLYHSMDVVENGKLHLLTPATGLVPMNRDFELVWQPALGNAPQASIFRETWDGADYALIMVMPPDTSGTATPMPREIVYVIDTSGSMGGTSIVQAKAALSFAIDQLDAGDRFNIVRFSGSARRVFRYAVTADDAHKQHAQRFVQGLTADGGTNIAAALDLALDEQADRKASADGFLRQVVFVTDGSVGNEQELFGQISSRLGNTRLFTVGIGSAPNTWFMRKSAEFGRGTYTHIGGDHVIEERMDSLLRRLAQPVLRDIEIAAPAGTSLAPAKIRDLYAGEPLLVRARLATEKGDFELRGKQISLPWRKTLALPQADDNPGVAALWGRSRIESLLDSLVTGADPQQVRSEVVQLALRHHLVSRYTSLVAVDHTPNRAPGTQLNSKRVTLTNPQGSGMTGYPAGATPAALLALFGLLTLLLSAASVLSGRRQ